MNTTMAYYTKRNYIEPMFSGISSEMMIMLCFFTTVTTFVLGGLCYFTTSNCLANSFVGFPPIRMFSFPFKTGYSVAYFYVFFLAVLFKIGFSSNFYTWFVSVCLHTVYASIAQTIKRILVLMEFGNMENFFASSTRLMCSCFHLQKIFFFAYNCLLMFFGSYLLFVRDSSRTSAIFTPYLSSVWAISVISLVFLIALLARTGYSKATSLLFVKRLKRKIFLAFSALFCYDLASHNVSLSNVMVKARNEEYSSYDWPVFCPNLSQNQICVNKNLALGRNFL